MKCTGSSWSSANSAGFVSVGGRTNRFGMSRFYPRVPSRNRYTTDTYCVSGHTYYGLHRINQWFPIPCVLCYTLIVKETAFFLGFVVWPPHAPQYFYFLLLFWALCPICIVTPRFKNQIFSLQESNFFSGYCTHLKKCGILYKTIDSA